MQIAIVVLKKMATATFLNALRIARNHGFPLRVPVMRSGITAVFSQTIHGSPVQFQASEADFEAAKVRLNSLKEDPGNDIKLKMYALFKQATVGPCDKPKPSALDFVAKAKWTAWSDLGNMTKEDAREEYVKTVDVLAEAEE